MNKATHAMLLALVGAYILYLACMLIQKALKSANEMPVGAAIAFSCVFAVGGVGVLLYAWRLWKQSKKETENHKDDKNDIK